MMAANLEAMLALCRVKLKDLSVRTFLEPELVASANEGKNELVKIIRQANKEYFETSTTGTLAIASAPNPTTITLPADFAELKEIMITDQGYQDIGFIKVDQADPRFRAALVDGGSFASGQGSFYYTITGLGTLLLAPGADLALNYKIWYTQTIPDMAFPTDAPTGIPLEHWDFIVTWMVTECLRSVNDPRLSEYLAKLDMQGKSVIASVGQRQIREPRFVRGYMEAEEMWG